MAQTYMVLDMIKAAFPECDTEIVTFTTKGDNTVIKFKGVDPEVDSNLTASNYPATRQYTLGVDVTF